MTTTTISRPMSEPSRGGVPAHRVGRHTYLMRRAMVVVLAILSVAVLLSGRAAAGGGGEAEPVTLSERAVYVVEQGDTLWSIAERLAPGDDPRRVVDRLERAAGSSMLTVGQLIVLPPGLGG